MAVMGMIKAATSRMVPATSRPTAHMLAGVRQSARAWQHRRDDGDRDHAVREHEDQVSLLIGGQAGCRQAGCRRVDIGLVASRVTTT
jgi:hypothetical protein